MAAIRQERQESRNSHSEGVGGASKGVHCVLKRTSQGDAWPYNDQGRELGAFSNVWRCRLPKFQDRHLDRQASGRQKKRGAQSRRRQEAQETVAREHPCGGVADRRRWYLRNVSSKTICLSSRATDVCQVFQSSAQRATGVLFYHLVKHTYMQAPKGLLAVKCTSSIFPKQISSFEGPGM